MEYFYFVLPFVVVMMVVVLMIGIQAGRKLGGNWSSGIALGTLLAILPPSVAFVVARITFHFSLASKIFD
jgi:hypothetical protein